MANANGKLICTCLLCSELKEKVFGTTTFWVTEIVPTSDFEQGILVRGNFRGPIETKFEEICEGVAKLYGMCRF